MIQILVVEDDSKLNTIVCDHLMKKGYQAHGCLNANDALNEMYGRLYDLVISDIMMPEMDGYEFAETVREINQNVPILFMTARDDFVSKQRGYAAGIDDYMTKPINLEELIWHIQALLRRSNIEKKQKLTVGNLVMDKGSTVVTIDGNEIETTVREFNILYKLLSYPGRTFSREQLLDEFWGIGSDSGLRAVDVYIARLRNKCADCSAFQIKTVYGLGYKAVLA